MSTFLTRATEDERPCSACGQQVIEGQSIYTIVLASKPWLPEDHEGQSWSIINWHWMCDRGSLAAANATDHRELQRVASLRFDRGRES